MGKYKPANGSEGGVFMAAFCERCERDSGYRIDGDNGCSILSAAMVFDLDEEEYPDEWVVGEDGKPYCTMFSLAGSCQHDGLVMLLREENGQLRLF